MFPDSCVTYVPDRTGRMIQVPPTLRGRASSAAVATVSAVVFEQCPPSAARQCSPS